MRKGKESKQYQYLGDGKVGKWHNAQEIINVIENFMGVPVATLPLHVVQIKVEIVA